MPPLMKIVSAISAGAGFRPQPETEEQDERRQRAIAQCVSALHLHHRLICRPFYRSRQAENTLPYTAWSH
jgi:hypothetical protein